MSDARDSEVSFTLPYVEPTDVKHVAHSVSMRFATRTFLSSFMPFAVLLAVSFWAIRTEVIATVRDGLRASVRENQVALAREQTRNEGRQPETAGWHGRKSQPRKLACNCWRPKAAQADQARNTVQDQLSVKSAIR